MVGVFNIDTDEAARSAIGLRELEPTRLCAGHGTTLTGDIREQFAASPPG